MSRLLWSFKLVEFFNPSFELFHEILFVLCLAFLQNKAYFIDCEAVYVEFREGSQQIRLKMFV